MNVPCALSGRTGPVRPVLALAGVVLLLFSAPALLGAQDQEEPLAAGSGNVPVPKKKKHVQPSYPPEALAEGVRGIVILDLIIDTDGRVVDTRTIRSIPGLDEAALIAVRQWLYEPVKVDGKLVRVRLTVPITFALKLPEITRAQGIPELRQGVTPPWPQGSTQPGSATADVTLDPDGRIGLARIIAGEEPWSTSLLQALRTWRFRAPAIDASLSFEVRAQFVPGKEKGTVKLRLASLRETALFDAPEAEESREVAALDPALTPGPDASEAPELAPTPDQDPAPEPSEGPEPPAKPLSEAAAAEGAAAASKAASGAPGGEGTAGEPDAPAPKAPIQMAEATPQPPKPAPPAPAGAAAAKAQGPVPTPDPETQTAAAETPPGGVDPTAPPPIEVLTAAPPPLPPENGI